MPDYIDQLFDANKPQQTPGLSGANLEDALTKDNEQAVVAQQPQQTQTAQSPVAPRQQRQTVNGLFGYNPNTGLDSVGKFLEQNVLIPGADLIDNLQGDKKTPDQIAKERQQQRLKAQQKTQATNKALTEAQPEPVRAVRGAIRGAAESTLNTAELVGDALQTLNPFRQFPTIGGPATQIADKDNIFSNKYEWAKWDLGRDEVGAKTPVGKVAQDLLEFVLLAAPTGGFGALRGIGPKLASAPGVLGKTGVLLKSAGYGAVRNAPADLAMALRGEGNLSNTLREAGLPNWATPLAIDENDTGASLAAKSVLEGNLIALPFSFAADGVEALLAGRRAVAAATKAGKTQDEAVAEGINELQETLKDSIPNAQSGHMNAQQYLDTVSYNQTHHPSRSWRIEPVSEEVLASGRPVTTDNITGVLDGQGGLHGIVIDPAATPSEFVDFIARARDEGVTHFSLYTPGSVVGGEVRNILSIASYREIGTSAPDYAQLRASGWDPQNAISPEEAALNGPRLSHYVLDLTGELRPSNQLLANADEAYALRNATAQQLAGKVPDLNSSVNEIRRLPANQQLYWFDRQPISTVRLTDLGVEAQLERTSRAFRTITLPNGTDVRFSFVKQPIPNGLLTDVRAVEVEFSVSGGDIGAYGKRIVSWWNRLVRDELSPGTVVTNVPASNAYGRGTSDAQLRRGAIDPDDRIRERIYRRMGFSKGFPDNEGFWKQYAVVRFEPTGSGRFLEPLRVELDPNEYYHGSFANPEDLYRQIQAQRNPYEVANQILSQSPNNTPSRAVGIGRLSRQAASGIPVTWDDVAAVTPELFTPGTRDVSQLSTDLQSLFDSLMDSPGSRFIYDPVTRTPVSQGYAVFIDGVELFDDSDEAISSFFARHSDIFSRTDTALEMGIRDGEIYIRPVRLIADEQEAIALGRLFDQPEIFETQGLRQINTYGSDNLRDTMGQHLASTYGVPVEPRLVTPTEALADQLNTQSLLNGRRASRRTVTQAQIRQIAAATSDGAGNLLRRMVQQNPIDLEELSDISRMSEEEIVMDAWRGMQDALGENFDVDMSQLLTQQVGNDVLLSRAGIVQVRGLMQELANQMYETAGPLMTMIDNNVDAIPAFSRLADNLKALMRVHKVSANVYGNMLRAYQIPIPLLGGTISIPVRTLTPEQLAREIRNVDQQLDGIVRRMAEADPEARQAGYRLLNALVLAEGDVSKMASLGKWMDKLIVGKGLSIFYNSLLAGPKTQLTNIVSGMVNTIYRPIAAATGGNASAKKAAAASFYNFSQTIQDAFDIAWRSMKDGAVNEGDKGFIEATQADLQLQILRKSAEISDDMGFKAGVGLIDMMNNIANFPLFNWPSKLLTGGDEFFKTMVSRMEYNSRTMMKAIEESAGTDDPVKEVFERLYKASYDRTFDPDTGRILDDELLDVAKDVTFQAELEGMAKSFGNFVNSVPVMKIFFPFVKTGHNILVYAGTHVPVLGKYLDEYKAVMAGEDEYAKAVMRGRQAWGTVLVLGAALSAHNGMITGNGPPDPEERKLWLKQHPARSIRVGDKWIDYSRIEPFGWLLSSVADLYDMTQRGRLSEDRAGYLAGYLTYAVAANFTNKSYMQGVVPLGRILTPGWQGIETLKQVPVDTINNFIPLAGVRSTFANMLTPYMQEYNEVLDRSLFRASGGLAKVGAPMYDWLDGSLVPNPNAGFNAINPIAIRTRKKDIVRDALEDIEFDNTVISKTVSKVKLDREQRSRMQQIMGNSTLHKELEHWIKQPSFSTAVKDFRARLAAGDRVVKENEPFYSEIVRIIERHRDAAVEQVKREFPELQGEIRENQILRDSQRRPQVDSSTIDLDRIVNMPK